MKSRWLIAAFPVAVSMLIYAVLQSAIASGSSPTHLYVAAGILARAAAAAGCAVAAAQFDAGDHMRRAWTAMGLTYVILLLNAVFFSSAIHLAGHVLSPTAERIVSGLLVGTANVSTIVGELMVARTWSAAGMDFQVSRAVKVGAVVGSLALALVIAGSSAWANVHLVAGGHLENLTDLFSALGDIVSLAVLAPILLTAVSLRGGSLAWPWGMIVLGTFGWVLFDGTATLSVWLNLDPSHVRPLTEAFLVMGCLTNLSAGLLQRSVRLDVAAPQPALG